MDSLLHLCDSELHDRKLPENQLILLLESIKYYCGDLNDFWKWKT
jgi:hypothetical protein